MEPKQDRIKALLRQNGIDGALVFSPENFHYVTGFAGHQHTVSQVARERQHGCAEMTRMRRLFSLKRVNIFHSQTADYRTTSAAS